jgi:MerR family transcriptional regulator, light-induced transcriptional regulator
MVELDAINDEPLYNIGVVSRMTGISMATLRAWERRYEFPESERTAGGHRLYSENDVLRLRWVKARIDEGMQTAQSINALRHQESTGHLILTANVLTPTQAISTEKSSSIQVGGTNDRAGNLEAFRQRLTDHLLQRNIEQADDVLIEALAVSTPEDLILKVIAPTIAVMGTYWEEGAINVAIEHLSTNYLRQKLLSWILSGPPPRKTRPIVLCCAPDEWHEGSLLVLGALLRRRRWPIAYLGQAMPLQDLAAFVGQIQPNLIVMVAMTEKTAESLAEWPSYLPHAAERKYPIIGYGGRVFMEKPEWRMKVQGMYLGNSFEDGVSTIERILVQQR